MPWLRVALAALCTANLLLGKDSPYHYVPTEWICILFVVLFGISTAAHAAQAVYYRLWWIFPTAVLSGVMEIAGWSARLWSSRNPLNSNAFTMQITLTIIGPTPLLASNFVIFGRIVRQIGLHYSRFGSRFYTIFFTCCDVVALVVQAAGGGLASGNDTPQSQVNIGTHVMQGGIFFQLVVIVIYLCFATEVFWRYWTHKPVRQADNGWEDNQVMSSKAEKRLELMVGGLAFMGILLVIRSIYRAIELTDGWNGRIISTQVYFNVLDGGMVTLAFFTLNFFHPGFLLRTPPKPSRPTDSSVTTLQVTSNLEKL
ncbi:RTA1-domain-containing protein [Dentipellis sp. KUC8613]|nr:RTA1-domain-containing protein [Dentipellis sp. KUC8613]